MKYFLLILFSLLLTVAPVSGQTSVPAPAPTPSVEVSLDTLNRAVHALESLSASNSSTVNAAVILQSVINLVIFGGGLLFVWRGGLKPMHSTMENDRKRAEKAELDEERTRLTAEADQKAQNEIRLKMSEALQRTAEAQERMATNTETRTEAKERTTTAVDGINAHTDRAHEDTRREIQAVRAKLDELIGVLSKRIGDEQLVRELEAVKRSVVKLGDTGELNPADVPDVDPSKPDAT